MSSPNMFIIFDIPTENHLFLECNSFTFPHCFFFHRFLNDLLDADVLMHIVEISGCTDETGEQTSGYDPSLDVAWLQEEIQ